jgi:ribonuclease BN (tRNA processing enzyme)
MVITTLGTSHGDHTYCRFNSSTLFEIGNSLYLIDSGAPVNGLMVRAKKDFGKVKAVFITHMHDDHVGGLPGLIKTLLKYPANGQHTHVYLPESNAAPALGVWLKAQHLPWPSELITVNTVKEGLVYSDGVLSVRAIGTHHLKHPDFPISFAYDLEAEGKRIMYTGDLSADFSDFPGILKEKDYDLCICECTHYSPYDALPVLQKCRIKRIIFNHIHNPWHGEGEEKLKGIMSGLPYPFEIAHDGDGFIL